MLFPSRFQRNQQGRLGRQKTQRPRRSFVPGLESLEARTVPSTVTVLNNHDSGAGSLRSIIAAATSGDTIVFAPSVHKITLTSGELDISKSLIIDGSGANNLSISGDNASQVFAISAGASVTLSGLTVTDGRAVTGGGIDNAGALVLSYCTLSANQSIGSSATPTESSPEGGGAILNEAGASLTLSHCTLTANTANAFSNTVDVFGGALLNEGSAIVQSSLFHGNEALGGGGSSFFGGSVGGGIDNFGGATLTVTNSTFTNNQALAAGAGSYGIGGAIENNAGLNDANPSTATISTSVFSGNVAGGNAGVLGNGGALDNEGTGAMMTIHTSTLHDNTSGESAVSGSIGLGGGLFTYSGSTTTVVGSTISDNLAVAGPGEYANGGGIALQNATMYLITSTVVGNQAIGGTGASGIGTLVGEGLGGGIMNTSSTLSIVDSMVDYNQAIGGANENAANQLSQPGAALGGGIENLNGSTLTLLDSTVYANLARGGSSNANSGGIALGGGIQNQSSALTITGGTVEYNRAIGGNGGSGYAGGLAEGGGLETSQWPGAGGSPGGPTTATVNDAVFSGNQAVGGNGGSEAPGGTAMGGGIAVGYLFGSSTYNSVLTLADTTLESNLAQGGSGGKGGNGGAAQGGGLAIQDGSSSTVFDSTITSNRAAGGAKGVGGSAGAGVGGGVYNLGMFNVDLASLIKKNLASTSNNNIFS